MEVGRRSVLCTIDTRSIYLCLYSVASFTFTTRGSGPLVILFIPPCLRVHYHSGSTCILCWLRGLMLH